MKTSVFERIVGFLGILLGFLIVYNRTRHRNTYSLIDGLSSMNIIIIKIICLLLIINITISIYNFTPMAKNKKASKILKYIISRFEHTNEYVKLRKFLDNYKIFFNCVRSYGVFDTILLYTFNLINYNRILRILTQVFDFIIFRRYFVNLDREKIVPIYILCQTKWAWFMFNHGYYVFKFIPIVGIQIIGILEILLKNEINLYYKLLFLLLPTFILHIISWQQLFFHTKQRQRYENPHSLPEPIIKSTFIMRKDSSKPPKFYETENVFFAINKELASKFTEGENKLLIDVITHHAIRVFAADELLYEMRYAHPISNLIIMLFSAMFLLLLIFY